MSTSRNSYSPPPRQRRPSRDEWALDLAIAASSRGECTRRRVGAVIIDWQRRQSWIAYNGAPPGEPSCLDGACPRGQHYRVERFTTPPHAPVPPDYYGLVKATCACDNDWPCPDSAAPDSSYDTGPTSCIATHAELGALMAAGRANLDQHCVMYVSEQPCPACERIIRGCLKRVVWPRGEWVFP